MAVERLTAAIKNQFILDKSVTDQKHSETKKIAKIGA